MKSIIAGILATIAMFATFSANATVAPAANNVVMIGCTAPSQTGATVYSIDNAIISGAGIDTLTLPTGVELNASCAVATNAINGVTCATGKTWVASPIVNVTISGSGYSLQQTKFTCQ